MIRRAVCVLLVASACGRADNREARPTAAVTSSQGTLAAKSTGAVSSPTLPKPACPPEQSHYWIRIEGDGEPIVLREGAARPPVPERHCEPAFVPRVDGAVSVVSGCAVGTNARRACLWSDSKHGAYYDRNGVYWKLAVTAFRATEKDRVVEGELTARATAREQKKTLKLLVRFRVGTDVRTVEAPGIWDQKGGWAEL